MKTVQDLPPSNHYWLKVLREKHATMELDCYAVILEQWLEVAKHNCGCDCLPHESELQEF